jgi:hypothetical protein
MRESHKKIININLAFKLTRGCSDDIEFGKNDANDLKHFLSKKVC